MRSIKRIGILFYALWDAFAAALAWTLFFLYRKLEIESVPFSWQLLDDANYYLGIIAVVCGWLLLYFISGTYTDIYRKSRLHELFITFVASVAGTLIIFFALLLDDHITSYKNYYESAGVLFLLHFCLTAFGRLTILNHAKYQLHSGKVGYRTLLIGGNNKALDLYTNITGQQQSLGYRFLGFITLQNRKKRDLEDYLPNLGAVEDIATICESHKVDEVIIAIETSEHNRLSDILNKLAGQRIVIKIIPDLYDILSGSVKMTHVLGAVLIEIDPEILPVWQQKLKRLFDVIVAGSALLILSPLYAYIALRVRFSSKGPIFYLQERVGKNQKPFHIIKFRSMHQNAEAAGPQLSSTNDKRITHWGKTMRKYRLDELPQFYNVLRGNMSIVGPRPERQFYIDKIVKKAPEYLHLLKVKPGITSWGMVKYGYAENVLQMIERMKYDLLYVENMSIAIDLKILIYTTLILVKGKGK